jgi:preprotein translocase subunit SecA
MTDAFARRLKPLGGSDECRIEGYRQRVAEIDALEKELEALSDGALRARSAELKQQLAAGVRARLKSASLAMRPSAKGYLG